MRKIDGDALEALLRKHGMHAAADLTATMPMVGRPRTTHAFPIVSAFLSSAADCIEIETSSYAHPISCYQSYRGYLDREHITACYCYMERGRVYLAKVPGRDDDAAASQRP